jgi:molybdate transport system permease protein
MSDQALSAVYLTLKVASLATLVVFVPSAIAAYFFARKDTFVRRILFTLAGMPMVLPPTAVGYLLLRFFAVDGPLGPEFFGFRINVILTWEAVVIASGIMAMPIVIRTAKVAFEGVDPRLESMSRTLGHGPVKTFFTVSLPLASRGLLAAAILGFTRAVGEFGAAVTVAGNIPYQTQTLASAIFSAQQVGQHGEAYLLIGFALLLGFFSIFTTEMLVRRSTAAHEAA